MRRYFFLLAIAMALHQAACGAGNSTTGGTSPDPTVKQAVPMKIKIRIKDRVLSVTLADSKTTQDFVSLLPLTLTMNDLFGREKYGHLPRELSEGGERTHGYEVGEIVYWCLVPMWLSFIDMIVRRFPIPASSSSVRSIPVLKLLM